MKINTRFATVFASLTLLATSAFASDASLRDASQAQKLSREQQTIFGPKSGNFSYDPRMIRAAEIAKRRAHPQMTWHCWKYVKDALLAADVISSRPTSIWANRAGTELCEKYGFKRLDVDDPYRAPVGAVVVYDGADGGHVELRTAEGFVSDFVSRTAYPRPLVGVYVKRS